jgi:hypothetical protein
LEHLLHGNIYCQWAYIGVLGSGRDASWVTILAVTGAKEDLVERAACSAPNDWVVGDPDGRIFHGLGFCRLFGTHYELFHGVGAADSLVGRLRKRQISVRGAYGKPCSDQWSSVLTLAAGLGLFVFRYGQDR